MPATLQASGLFSPHPHLSKHTTAIMKRLLPRLLPLILALLAFASCKETEEVGEYDNWQQRNADYITSIAQTARANADGQWRVYRSFKLTEKDIKGNIAVWDDDDYIYCHVEETGAGTTSPLFTDTVMVNYRGRLMPNNTYPEGRIFDQSFKGELRPEFNSPTKFSVGGVVVGFSTALQKMHVGDIWRVYIPAKLGYNASAQTNSGIPAYSTLIFDINLASYYSPGY